MGAAANLGDMIRSHTKLQIAYYRDIFFDRDIELTRIVRKPPSAEVAG